MKRDNTSSILLAIFAATAVFVVLKMLLAPLATQDCAPISTRCLAFQPQMIPVVVGAVSFGISWILLDYANVRLRHNLLMSLALCIALIVLGLKGYL